MTRTSSTTVSESLWSECFTEAPGGNRVQSAIIISGARMLIWQCDLWGREQRVDARPALPIWLSNRYDIGHEAAVDTGMRNKLLSKRPSSFYLKQFHEEDIEVLPTRQAGYYRVEEGELVRVTEDTPHAIHFGESPGGGILTIEDGNSSFDLCFPCEDGHVLAQAVGIGREVLGRIGGLDSTARAAAGQNRSAGAELAFVEVGLQQVALHYCGCAEYTEWCAVFLKVEQSDADWTLEEIA